MNVAIQPGFTGVARYVLIPLFCAITGYTPKAIRRKIQSGVWLQDQQWRKAPDGHILIDIDAYHEWVEHQTSRESRFEATPSKLLIGRARSRPVRNIAPAHDVRRDVPLISWVQAADWRKLAVNFHAGDADRWVATDAKVGKQAFALRIVGDSMTNPSGAPSFPEGTVIIVDPGRDAKPGKYVVVHHNADSECTFKQLVRDAGKHYLKPLNPRYPLLEMLPDAVICGVLAQAVTDF